MTVSTDTVSSDTLRSISTPDTVETKLGTLGFDDGAPTPETAELLYDHLDYLRGVEAYLNSIPAASLNAIRRGFLSVGVEDNQVLDLPRANGCDVALPDAELGHGLLLDLHRPH